MLMITQEMVEQLQKHMADIVDCKAIYTEDQLAMAHEVINNMRAIARKCQTALNVLSGPVTASTTMDTLFVKIKLPDDIAREILDRKFGRCWSVTSRCRICGDTLAEHTGIECRAYIPGKSHRRVVKKQFGMGPLRLDSLCKSCNNPLAFHLPDFKCPKD